MGIGVCVGGGGGNVQLQEWPSKKIECLERTYPTLCNMPGDILACD